MFNKTVSIRNIMLSSSKYLFNKNYIFKDINSSGL